MRITSKYIRLGWLKEQKVGIISFVFMLALRTVCGDLDSQLKCPTKNGTAGVSMGVAKDECASACAEFARGMPGCCVWQEDWKKCVFVPRETTKQNTGLRAGVECTVEHGLYQIVCNI